jgi:putative transposase
MKIQKAYKFRFYPTEQQINQLSVEFGNARFVWNHALSMRKKAYERRNETLNYVPLNKHINKLKKTNKFEWLNQSTGSVLTQKIIDLDKAYTNFFKHGAKFPRFKKKIHAQSVRYQLDQRQIDKTYSKGEFLKIPKLGEIDIKWSRVPKGIPKMATISKTSSGKYFVSFACEVEIQEHDKTGKSVGIDIGIKDVVVTSDGFFSGSPKFTYKYQRELKLEQRKLSRKTRGSKRWHKQRIVVANIHEKIANCRKDFLHKLTTNIVKEYDVIFLEDLNVSGMMKNRCLSKAISDVGIFELNRQIKYKSAWNDKKVVVIDRWFPSSKTCSSCGQIHPMKLSDRTMNCDCGLTMDRDLNASINIKATGEVVLARGASNQPDIAQVA